ncbi:MAG: SCP2 sterol-binding domain-containing protein [Acidimicrobiales bacterium]
MAAHLSEGWLDHLKRAAADLPERADVTARIQHVVTGTPAGEVRYRLSWLDGRLADAGLGDDPDADVTFLQTHADALQVARGEVGVEVAFMQGRAKVTGDMGRVMALMPLLTSDEYRSLIVEVSEQTEY